MTAPDSLPGDGGRQAREGASARAPRSLQALLLRWVLGLVAGVWVVTAALTWRDVSHELDELLDSHLAQAAALLVAWQVGDLDDDDHEGIHAPTLHRYAPKVAFQVFHEGRLVLRSAQAPLTPMLGAPVADGDGFHTVDADGVAWRVFATRGRERDIQVFVGEQLASRQAILWAVLRSTLAPMLLALPLLALAAWWAVRQGLSPLRALGRTLSQRRPQALEPVELHGAPAEMTPMLDALNALFERIGSLMAAERRFTADAAHELRTPIASIRAQAQVALAATGDDERARALRFTVQGCDRAARLVDQLLTLSRLETGQAPALVTLDLAPLVRQVVADAAPQALDKGQAIAVQDTGVLRVRAEPVLLSVLVRNLVDNAIRYSPADARVEIVLHGDAAGVTVTVEDSGPGMTEADRQRLGERFFRVIGTGQSGSGLGWSIVRRVARVFAAEVEVAPSARLGGLAVTVRLPAGAADRPSTG